MTNSEPIFIKKKKNSQNYDLSESWLKINRSKQYFILKSQLFVLTKVDDNIYKKMHDLSCTTVHPGTGSKSNNNHQ